MIKHPTCVSPPPTAVVILSAWPYAIAASMLLATHAFAQESTTGPKIRILSSRDATVEPSAGDTRAIAAAKAASAPQGKNPGGMTRLMARSMPPPPPKPAVQSDRVAPMGPQPPASQFLAASQGNSKALAKVRASDTANAADSAEKAEDQIAKDAASRREKKLAEMRQAMAPRNAGVPRLAGGRTWQGATGPAMASVPQKPGGTRVAAEATPAPAPVQPLPPTSAIPGSARSGADPLAAEVSRSGEDYYFNGKLNGQFVRFRIREGTSGIRIPVQLAMDTRIITAPPKSMMPGTEWVTPIQSMVFGAHPVSAVMARIAMIDGDVVEVGPDALGSFKISDVNGRHMLIPTAAKREAPAASSAEVSSLAAVQPPPGR